MSTLRTSASSDSPTSSPNPVVTFLIVAGSSVCFCTKGVFAKLAYRHGLDFLTVLALRMLVALPFFVVIGWTQRVAAGPRLTRRDWFQLAGLGFLGYYLSSFANFAGLQWISVGLERVVLYTYPSLVLLGNAVVYRRRVSRGILFATAVSYLGILCAFAGESGSRSGRVADLALGAGLVFLSAITYAAFILVSGETVKRLGPFRFTSHVVSISCGFILLHFLVARPLGSLMHLPLEVYGYGLALGLLGTVIPSYLLGLGLRRTGPQKFAVIGTLGPIVTLLLAWWVLGEPLRALQGLGFLLSLAGGLAVSLQKE